MNLSLSIKAEGAAAALKAVTGERPVVSYEPGGYAKLYWDPNQIARLQGKVDQRLTQGVTMALAPAQPPKAGDLVVDWGPVVNPVLMRKALPAAIGLGLGVLAVGFVLGRVSHGRSRR